MKVRLYVIAMMVMVAILAAMCNSYSSQMEEYKSQSTDFTCQPGEVYTTQECP